MKTNHILALLAIIAGISAAFTRYGTHNDVYPDWKFSSERIDGRKVRFISATYLADMIYSKDENLLIYDTRPWKDFEEYHIPKALHFEKELAGKTPSGPLITVICGNPEDSDSYDLARELPGKVYVLKGGMDSWYSQVLFPDFINLSVRNTDLRDHILRRSTFFGGQPQNIQVLNIEVRENRYREGC